MLLPTWGSTPGVSGAEAARIRKFNQEMRTGILRRREEGEHGAGVELDKGEPLSGKTEK